MTLRDLDTSKILQYEDSKVVGHLGLIPTSTSQPLSDYKEFDIDVKRERNLLTTQLPIHNIHGCFKVSLFVPMKYRPDIKIGNLEGFKFIQRLGEGVVSVHELVTASSAHHGPLIKSVKLQNSDIPSNQIPSMDLKFVVQLFE